ncbi:putative transcriptional regulatory protein Sin3 [Arabidopsis thaliana]
MADADELMKTNGVKTQSSSVQTRLRSSVRLLRNPELTRELRRLKDNNLNRKIDHDEKPEENPILLNEPKMIPRIRIVYKPKDDVERKMKDRLEAKQKLTELLKAIEERLTRSELRVYTCLCKDFKSHRIDYSQFVKSLQRLIEKYKNLYQRFVDIAYGHGEDEAGTRVKVDDNPQDTESDKIKLEGKGKRGMLPPKESDQPERPLKKRRKTERATPNYKLIPKEEQTPVSSTVLNNTWVVNSYDIQAQKNLTDIEKDMYNWEDQMFELDMLVGFLTSAAKNAEEVINGERDLKDLGGKFYICAENLYGRDMLEIVKENHQRVLPVILNRLNQKLREVTPVRERLKPVLKQTIEKLSTRQRGSTAQESQVKTRTI